MGIKDAWSALFARTNKPGKAEKPIDNTDERSVERSTYYPDASNAPYNPASLFSKRGDYTLFDFCLRDDVVESILEYKKNLILGGGHFVESDDEDVRDFWQYVLNDTYEGSFQQTLRKLLSSLDYGFSWAEPIFKPVVYEGKQYWGLDAIKVRPPHGVLLKTDDYGNIETICQQGLPGANKDAELDPKGFLLFTYRPRFENPYGRADINEGVFRSCISKENLIKDLNIALHNFAMPFVDGVYPQNARPENKDELFSIIQNFVGKAGAAHSKDYEIKLIESARNMSDQFLEGLNFYNLSIARAMLVSDLQGVSGKQMSSGGLGGSLGDVQFNVMVEIFKRIRHELLGVLNRKVIWPLTKYNFGPDVYAELKINELTKDEKYRAADMFLKYVQVGGGKPTFEQQNWFMENIGAPIGEQLEDQEDAPGDPPVDPNAAPGKKPLDPEPDSEPDPDEIDPGNAPELDPEDNQEDKDKNKPKMSWDEPSAPARELTKPEQRVNFTAIEQTTRDLSSKGVSSLSEAIKASLQKLIAWITDKRVVENKRFMLLRKMSLPGIGGIRAAFDAMMNEALTAGRTEVKQELKANMAITAADIATEDIVKAWIKSKVAWLTKDVEDSAIKTIERVISDAMRNGMGTREAIQMLDQTLEDDLGTARLETIVRTNTMTAFNQGRLTQMGTAPGLIGLQWSSILDDRTSEVCRAMDGKIIRTSEAASYPVPAHYNCRSVLVPVFGEDVEGQSEKDIFGNRPTLEHKDGFLKMPKGGE